MKIEGVIRNALLLKLSRAGSWKNNREMWCGWKDNRYQVTIEWKENDLITIRRYFDNGNIAWEHNYKNMNKEGVFRAWSKDGRLTSCGHYTNNKLNGEYKEWSALGSLICERHYKNGKFHGPQKKWSTGKNPFLLFDAYYLNGRLEGILKIRSQIGRLIFLGVYKNGKKNGLCKQWCYDGRLIEECEWSNGKRHGTHTKYRASDKVVKIWEHGKLLSEEILPYKIRRLNEASI